MMTSSNGNMFRVTGPLRGKFTGHFDIFYDLRLNNWLSKQSRWWWYQTPSRSLWRHSNVDNRAYPPGVKLISLKLPEPIITGKPYSMKFQLKYQTFHFFSIKNIQAAIRDTVAGPFSSPYAHSISYLLQFETRPWAGEEELMCWILKLSKYQNILLLRLRKGLWMVQIIPNMCLDWPVYPVVTAVITYHISWFYCLAA